MEGRQGKGKHWDKKRFADAGMDLKMCVQCQKCGIMIIFELDDCIFKGSLIAMYPPNIWKCPRGCNRKMRLKR